METKKTLAECKDEIAVISGYESWKDYESNIGTSAAKMNEMWLAAIDILNAELYAGQTKQSSQVSLEVDSILDEMWDKPLNRQQVNDFVCQIGEEIKKSQQPASIAFLSDEEINLLFPKTDRDIVFNSYQSEKRQAVKDIQSELRKRVIDLNDFAGWLFGGHDKNVEESIVNDYINSKTK